MNQILKLALLSNTRLLLVKQPIQQQQQMLFSNLIIKNFNKQNVILNSNNIISVLLFLLLFFILISIESQLFSITRQKTNLQANIRYSRKKLIVYSIVTTFGVGTITASLYANYYLSQHEKTDFYVSINEFIFLLDYFLINFS